MSSPEKIRPKIHPSYAEGFQCIGPECEDNCCRGWNVYIDRQTYAKYQLLPAGALRSAVEQHVQPTGGDANDFYFAKITLNQSGECPLWTDEHLCGIQKELGAEALSLTCASYPRGQKTIDEATERTLLLSCPEAARQVLLTPRLAVSGQEAAGSHYAEFLQLEDEGSGTGAVTFFWVIRSFIVRLLQDGSYPLWQRLFLLGMLCGRLDDLVAKQEAGRIPGLLRGYAELVSNGMARSAMDGIAAQPAVQLGLVMTLLEHPVVSSRANVRLAECLRDFCQGLGYVPGCTAASLREQYLVAYQRYYEPWVSRHPHVFENYLLNYIFAHLFPFGHPLPASGVQAQREFFVLCAHYGCIKTLLIGMAGHFREEFGAAHVVKLVQSFSKATEHNAGYMQETARFFEANRLNTTTGIAVLLRDGGC